MPRRGAQGAGVFGVTSHRWLSPLEHQFRSHIWDTHTVSPSNSGPGFEGPKLCCLLALSSYLSGLQWPRPHNGGNPSDHLAWCL